MTPKTETVLRAAVREIARERPIVGDEYWTGIEVGVDRLWVTVSFDGLFGISAAGRIIAQGKLPTDAMTTLRPVLPGDPPASPWDKEQPF